MRGLRTIGLRKRIPVAGRLAAVRRCAAAALCVCAVLLAGVGTLPADEGASGVFGGLTAWAAGSAETRVFDGAGLFSGSEIDELEEAAAETRREAGFDAAVMTTDDADGKSARMYAADRYEELGLGDGSDYSGVLFLIDMDNREIYLLTTGKAIRVLTDDRINAILDEAYEAVSNGDYAAGAETALEQVAYYAGKGIVSGQYNYDEETGRVSVHRYISVFEVLVALILAGVIAGSAVMTVKRQYNMEESEQQIANHNLAYRATSRIDVADHTDRLMGTFVTSMLIARAVSNQHPGGPSGRSSSGRSTTFHSSSGGSHGGGGRKF